MANLNYVPIEEWEVNQPAYSPNTLDYDVTHNGEPSIRNEGVLPWRDREVNSPWIAVKPGDHLVFTAYIKTGDYTIIDEKGARIGIDIYGAKLGLQAHESSWVPWGTNWSLRKIDIYIPERINGLLPIGVICWFQPWAGYTGQTINKELAPAWMSEPTLYINPVFPEPPPPPVIEYVCNVCGAYFYDLEEFNEHLKTHEPPTQQGYNFTPVHGAVFGNMPAEFVNLAFKVRARFIGHRIHEILHPWI